MDQVGYANLGFTANLTTVAEGFALQPPIRSLFAVHDIFFRNGQGLNPTWRTEWTSAKVALKPFLAQGSVLGVFIGDELISGGKVTYAEFMTCLEAVSELKADHPSLFTWLNEGGTSWTEVFKKVGGLPAKLDIISLDDYSLSVQQHRSFYEQSIYPLMNSKQSAFLVPGAFATRGNSSWTSQSQWCCGGDTPEACDECMVNRTQGFWQWALEDPRITGMAPWHWDTRGKDEVSKFKEVGVADMPKLKSLWKHIHDTTSNV